MEEIFTNIIFYIFLVQILTKFINYNSKYKIVQYLNNIYYCAHKIAMKRTNRIQ